MDLLSVICRCRLQGQIFIRDIASRTGLRRNAIGKYLYRNVAEPALKLPDWPSKLDAFAKCSG